MPGDLMTWPDVGGGQIVYFILLFAGAAAVFLATRWIYLRAGRRDARWSVLMQDALRHRVRRDDLKILRAFFFTALSADETLRVISDRRFFHSRLHDYLLAQHSRDPEAIRRRVRLFESLFPTADFQLEIKSLRDLQPGEVCSLEFADQGEPRLATILRSVGNDPDKEELWLSVPEWQPAGTPETRSDRKVPGDSAESGAHIYVYRPGSGGFLIQGRILRAGNETVVFGEVEDIQSRGEQHLMAAIEVPLTLRPWPPVPPAAIVAPVEGGNSEEDSSSLESRPSIGAAASVQIEGVSKLISDRALLFFTNDQTESHDFHLMEGQEIWEIDLVFPRGLAFRCRGIVLPSGADGRGRWLFKYLDASEGQRRAIFEEIKRAGAKRERLV
ncbi:MAG: hypothetical protein NXI24_18145 [bacterium]|nr:hypothetical protein [bacterium]